MDSGATHLYIAANAPHGPLDTSATKIRVGTANGKLAISTEKATLPIPELAADFLTTGYIMPMFTNTLIGISPICDANCTVVFKNNLPPSYHQRGSLFSKGGEKRNSHAYGSSL